MTVKSDITNIRNQVEGFIGNRVQIRANKGRKRIVVKEGYVENTYRVFL